MTGKYIKHFLGHQFILRNNYLFTYDCLICGIDVYENYEDDYRYRTYKSEYEFKLTLTCNEIIIKKLLE